MNEDQKITSKREADQKHHQQFIWQILIPLLAAVIIALGIAVLDILKASSEIEIHSRWAMISTVLLVLIWLILGLVPLALVVLGIWLMTKSRKSITPYLVATSLFLDRVRMRAQGITDGMASPVIKIRSINAGLRQLLMMVLHLNSSSKE